MNKTAGGVRAIAKRLAAVAIQASKTSLSPSPWWSVQVLRRNLTMAKSNVKCVLVDLSGTIHIDDMEIPGSVEALERLRKSGLHVKFVTNTTKESGAFCMIVSVAWDSVLLLMRFSPPLQQRKLIEQKKVRPMLMVDDKALEDFEGIVTENPDAVVVGLAPDKFDYSSMNAAFRLMLNGAPLIAIHKARYYKRKDGLALGPGPFVTALEYSTDQKADVVGKPEASFFLEAVKEFGCKPAECVMIGDDARDDVGGAQNCGMSGILVKTGKYRQGDEKAVNPPPAYLANDFAAAVDYILSSLAV